MWSNDEGITELTQFGKSISRPVDHKQMLKIALEPECAALSYCKYQNDNMADYSDRYQYQANKSYLVLDIGGGTVDITTLMYTEDGYKIGTPPLGNTSGGMKVNNMFSDFLQDLVGDRNFTSFRSGGAWFSNAPLPEFQAALSSMIYYDFEKLKVEFGDKVSYPLSEEGTLYLLLERKFVNFGKFRKKIQQCNVPGICLKNDALHIKYSKMAEFFEPVLRSIRECVLQALDKVEMDKINAVLFAGGFGGCKYVFEFLKSVISRRCTRKQPAFLVPTQYELVVSMGGIHYCRQPEIIVARKIDASYGLCLSYTFLEGIHREDYAYRDDDDQKLCRNVVRLFVEKDQIVKTNEVYTIGTIPVYKTQLTSTYNFYRSTNPNVVYATDENTEKIGELVIDTPNPDNLPKHKQNRMTTLSFSYTEITACTQALYLPGQPFVRTTLDFLT